MLRSTLRTALLCLVAGLVTGPLRATLQDPQPGTAPVQTAPLDDTTRRALEQLSTMLAEKREQRAAATQRGDTARAAALDVEVRDLGWQFAGLASRLDVQDFEAPMKGEFDLKQELEQLVRPLLKIVRDATEEPRQVADLEARIEVLRQRQRTAEDAQRAVERTRAALPAGSPALAEIAIELRDRWQPTIAAIRGEILVLQAQLQARSESKKSLFSGIRDAVQQFVQSSGTSLLLSILVFLATFSTMRWITNLVLSRRSSGRGFSLRLLEVALRALNVLLAIAATMVVPYARNDWLLLAVCIVFLIGAGWVLVRTLPQFFEQIRLVLNVGGVREGERILVDGLPFRVCALRFYSRLENPDLQGGNLRVPIQYLVGKRSRPSGQDEPWFPCRKGDFVTLEDGVTGTVLVQTPETVVVEHLGSPRSYPTVEFLRQAPRNLSRGFVVLCTFDLDYRHMAEATTTVPRLMQEALEHGLRATAGPGELQHLRVELRSAEQSSLEFVALATFAGSAAPRFFEWKRRMQALLVTACHANGWTIPFPQLTVHQAKT